MSERKKQINDPVFGKLQHAVADLWKGEISVMFLGERTTVELLVDVDEAEGLEQKQIRSFQQFQSQKEEMLKAAERCVLRYYQSVCEEYRERLGVLDPNDKRVPIVSTVEDLGHLVNLTGVSVPYARNIETIGLIAVCTWEVEHGLGVLIEKGAIVEVGFQDVVL